MKWELGNDFGGAHLDRGVLGVVEYLEVIEARSVDGTAVAVPIVGRGRAGDAVVAEVLR